MDQEEVFVAEVARLAALHPGVVAGADIQDDGFAYLIMADPVRAAGILPCLAALCEAADVAGIDLGMDVAEGTEPEAALERFGILGFTYSEDGGLFRSHASPVAYPSLSP